MGNRKKHSSKFKFKVVVESIETNSVSKVARQYDINPSQISNWRKEFQENGHQIFETSVDKEITALQKHIKKLEQIVGKKEVELSLLKNYLDFYTSQSGE